MHLRTSSTCRENAYLTFRFPIYLLAIKATTEKKHEAILWQRELNENWPLYLVYENFILTYSAKPRIACFHFVHRSSTSLSTRSLMRTSFSNERITSSSHRWQEPSSILRSLKPPFAKAGCLYLGKRQISSLFPNKDLSKTSTSTLDPFPLRLSCPRLQRIMLFMTLWCPPC